MKKLNKLCIKTERLLKNEELMTLRGGYAMITCYDWATQCGGGYGECSNYESICNDTCGTGEWNLHICYPL